MRLHRAQILTAFVMTLITLDWSPFFSPSARGETSPAIGQPGKINLAISIQWEGEGLLEENLDAIRQFRKKFGSINFLHFINPVYFTKPGANPADVAKRIKTVISDNDTIGLQVLGWKSLVKSAGVEFRNKPTFWGYELSPQKCLIDCGHEIPITAYSKDELVKIINHGAELLTKNGFPRPRSFMAGGWMGSNHVLEAAVQSGFQYDFSGVPPHLVQGKIQQYPLFTWINSLWSETTALSQPAPLPTQSGWIQECYNNGATMDYVTEKDVVDLYRAYANLLKKSPTDGYLIHIGIYQETAGKTISRLQSALQTIFADSATNQVPVAILEFPRNSDSGNATVDASGRSVGGRLTTDLDAH